MRPRYYVYAILILILVIIILILTSCTPTENYRVKRLSEGTIEIATLDRGLREGDTVLLGDSDDRAGYKCVILSQVRSKTPDSSPSMPYIPQ